MKFIHFRIEMVERVRRVKQCSLIVSSLEETPKLKTGGLQRQNKGRIMLSLNFADYGSKKLRFIKEQEAIGIIGS